jgi:hypothetical protein
VEENFGRRDDFYVVRDREYPRDGADAYGALPDNAIVYVETLPKSKHARDPLYALGDADAALPLEPAEAAVSTTAEPPAEPAANVSPEAASSTTDEPSDATSTDEPSTGVDASAREEPGQVDVR